MNPARPKPALPETALPETVQPECSAEAPQAVFRADASLLMGSGHLMRCLTLALELRRLGVACCFVGRRLPGQRLDLPRAQGFEVLELPEPEAASALGLTETPPDSAHPEPPHAAWLPVSWQDDALQTRQALGHRVVDWLIVDHYALDSRWQQALRPACGRLLVLDDLADRPHRADALLDQNLGRLPGHYQRWVPSTTSLMIGPRFALLRPDFAPLRAASLQRRAVEPLRHLLISLGGVDGGNVTGHILTALHQAWAEPTQRPAGLRLTVVMGSQAPWVHSVREQVQQLPWPAELRLDVPDMAALLANADVAVGAAGGSAWERCCLGLPTVLLILADNQRPGAQALAKAQAVRLVDETAADAAAEVLRELEDLFTHPNLGAALSRASAQLTDGLGAQRVAQTLFPNDGDLLLRPARLSDAQRLLDWRNDPATRAASHHSDAIPFASHLSWLQRALLDSSGRIWIACLRGQPVGTVRTQRRAEGDDLLSWTVAPEARGQGLACRMVSALAKTLPGPLHAEVKASNPASARVAQAAGLLRVAEHDGVLHFHRAASSSSPSS